MAKKPTLDELRLKYNDRPTSSNSYVIDGVPYNIVSHYVGSKDVSAVVLALATTRAYSDLTSKEAVNKP